MRMQPLLLEDVRDTLRAPILWFMAALMGFPLAFTSMVPSKVLWLQIVWELLMGVIVGRMCVGSPRSIPRVIVATTDARLRSVPLLAQIALVCVVACIVMLPALGVIAFRQKGIELRSLIDGYEALNPLMAVAMAGWTGVVIGALSGLVQRRTTKKPARAMRAAAVEIVAFLGMMTAASYLVVRLQLGVRDYARYWWAVPAVSLLLVALAMSTYAVVRTRRLADRTDQPAS